MSRKPLMALAAWLLLAASGRADPGGQQPQPDAAVTALARSVLIYRDAWGTPHIDGPTDESVVFGFAYAQAEDYFWQVEDTYILGLGRYSEVHGPSGLNSDLLNRAFEIVRHSRQEYDSLEPPLKRLYEAFVDGLNYYLRTHPATRPRLIRHFEPWQVVAVARHLTLELTFRYSGLSNSFLPRMLPNISGVVGSNGWAIAPSRTRDGKAMLFVNPHQPWFGFGQFYEAHLRSGEGWNFSGATFFGSPLPSIGHNEHLGWTFTTNEPDIADVWRETFDDPQHPLRYRYGDGYRTAEAWDDTLRIKTNEGYTTRSYHFCRTHHGPIVAQDDAQHRLAVGIARLYDTVLLRQTRKLLRARNFAEYREALSGMNYPIMNSIYADREGNIFYLYNGIIPRRNPRFDWSKPVDGSDPATEWQGFHALNELPQVLNPACGYVQNCNSSPFTTTNAENPNPGDFPAYMVQEKHDDKRRAKRSREMLSAAKDLTFEELERWAFDTTIYWAKHELPEYGRQLKRLEEQDPVLAARVAPYLEHLLDWDCRSTHGSTQATLCAAWYEQLYGGDYPGEALKPRYQRDIPLRLRALVQAAAELQAVYGNWKVPFGEAHRIQRHADVADLLRVPFDDALPSLPCAGTHGPMGVIFTVYYTPTINIPLVRTLKNHYGIIGPTYMAVYEFGEKVRGASLLHFGASGDPRSEHYFDQARLMSDQKLKRELFDWDEVRAEARRVYHPGEEATRTGPANRQVEKSNDAKARS
jgi:acyl-homoserine lactone acylase PvdQ